MWLMQPRLINEPFSDPGLYLDERHGRRALLFDIGDLSPLSAREIVRISDVFVSHMHLDHFSGFDLLLRFGLYQDKTVRFFGPPGLCAAVENKLSAYTWNLLGPHSLGFALDVREWTPDGFGEGARFAARQAFERAPLEPITLPEGVLLEDPAFRIEAAQLDHGIDVLAFAFQEKMRVHVHRNILERMGLQVGPWLTEAKRAVRADRAEDQIFETGGAKVRLGDLLECGAITKGPGIRIAYATDLAHTPDNVEKLVRLGREADLFFIEGGFLAADTEMAAGKKHLTARQAGEIARQARATRAKSFHYSARYLDQEAQLRAEFEAAFAGAPVEA